MSSTRCRSTLRGRRLQAVRHALQTCRHCQTQSVVDRGGMLRLCRLADMSDKFEPTARLCGSAGGVRPSQTFTQVACSHACAGPPPLVHVSHSSTLAVCTLGKQAEAGRPGRLALQPLGLAWAARHHQVPHRLSDSRLPANLKQSRQRCWKQAARLPMQEG